MENLPTELFLARILRPTVCRNEEGNIISIPPPVTTPFRLRLPAFPLARSFSFSLIESSNFRLHSPSLPTGENSKDIVSKLGERESAEGCTVPGADSRMKEGGM